MTEANMPVLIRPLSAAGAVLWRALQASFPTGFGDGAADAAPHQGAPA